MKTFAFLQKMSSLLAISSAFLFLLLTSSLSFAASAHAQPQSKPITVQINWNHQFQYAGFYAAIKQGYYQDAGLDVTLKAWQPGINPVDEVLAGRADYATGYSSIIADYAKGKPLTVVMASFQFSPMMLLSHFPVSNLQQMAGKTVMHYGNLQVQGLINKANAVNAEPVKEVSSSGKLQDFIDHEVDFYAAYQTNEPNRLDAKKIPYYSVDPKSYGIQSYGDLIFTHQDKAFSEPHDVAQFRDSTIKGWEYAIAHQAEIVDYIIENYPVKKSREALLYEARETTKYVKSGHNPIGNVENGKLYATAIQAFESGLISRNQLNNMDIDGFTFKWAALNLTEEELVYIAANPTLNLANSVNLGPFEFIGDDGIYDGIAADYLKWVARKLGLEWQVNQELSREQALIAIERGGLDIAPVAMETNFDNEALDFTTPYMAFPVVLVAPSGSGGYLNQLHQLDGKRIAVVTNWYTEEFLQESYPHIELHRVSSVESGIESVLSNKADFYLGSLAAINYTLQQSNLDGVKVVGTVDELSFEVSMAVSQTKPVLFSIIQKALNSMPESERARIHNRWMSLKVVNQTDHALLYRWLFVGLLVIALMSLGLLWSDRQKKRKQAYIENIHELSLASYTSLPEFTLDWVSDSFCRLTGYDKDELQGKPHDTLRDFLEPENFYDAIKTQISQGNEWRGEIKGTKKNGEPYWVELVATPEVKRDKVIGFWTTRTDITHKKYLEDLTIKDVLTDCFNRRHFNEVFESKYHQAMQKGKAFEMALIDIDYFKQVNDYWGHQYGDEVLVQVVDALKQKIKPRGDMLFRIGGEEFVVIGGSGHSQGFAEYLEQLRETIEELGIENPNAPSNTVTISIGAIQCRSATLEKPSMFYSLVDGLLYEAKRQGRNRVVLKIA